MANNLVIIRWISMCVWVPFGLLSKLSRTRAPETAALPAGTSRENRHSSTKHLVSRHQSQLGLIYLDQRKHDHNIFCNKVVIEKIQLHLFVFN